MNFLPRISDIWRKVVARWWRAEAKILTLPHYESSPSRPSIPTQEESTQPVQPTLPLVEEAASYAATEDSLPVSVEGNRHWRRKMEKERRKLERARRKHDKFVKPNGPEPVHFSRGPQEPKKEDPKPESPQIEMPFDDPNDRLIADEWLDGDGTKVLYEGSEFLGEFNFRDTILDQLERYWIYLERMRRYDSDAYEFYKKIGATLVPYASTGTFSEKSRPADKIMTPEELDEYKSFIVLPSHFKTHWPTFGCVAFGANPRDEKAEMDLEHTTPGKVMWIPKFMYFHRLSRMPWTVQPARDGHFYMLTVWWDRPQDKGYRRRWGVPMDFPIQIKPNGEMRVLKTRRDGKGKVRAEYDWRFPYEYKEWSKQYGLDPQTHIAHMFCNAVKHCEYSNFSMIRVTVSKGDLTAVFGISPRRTSYFFQDRDVTLTAEGRKQPIFHMVRPYVKKDGTAVAMQFRGLPEFEWAGYHVKLTVPGRDHLLLPDFDLSFTPDMERRKGSQKPGQLAETLRGWMEEGKGGTVH